MMNKAIIFLVGWLIFAHLGVQDQTNSPTQTQKQNNFQGMAGRYYQGDGLGANWNLTLDENGSFRFQWHGCLGLYQDDVGSYSHSEIRLVIEPENPNRRWELIGTKFTPVKWGERQYLVLEKDMLKFCNAINQGREPRKGAHGRFYLGKNHWTIPVTGLPELSKDWQPYLLVAPTRGRIVELVDGRGAIVNLGSRDGIRVGMVLTAQPNAEQKRSSQVTVTSVEKMRCVVSGRIDRLMVGQFVTSQFRDEGKVKRF